MKLKLFSLALFIMAGVVAGQSQTLYRLGFCDGKVSSESKLTVEGAVEIEAAIFLSADDLSRFSGDAFAGVNAGIATKLNVRDITVWLRSELDGQNIAEASADALSSPKPRDGWNSLKFDAPVAFEAGKGYYVGYTLHQTKTSSIVSTVDGSHAGASYIKIDTQDWAERPDLGVLSIEALISGDNLPRYDLVLETASVDGTYYLNGTPLTVDYALRNDGVETVNSYMLTVSVDGTGIEVSRTVSNVLAYGVSRNYVETFDIPGLKAGATYGFSVKVSGPDDHADETPDNNILPLAELPVIDRVFDRTVLLEEFTTEKCSNCPAAAETVHDMIASLTDAQRQRFAMACHHSGYYTDGFTLDCDESYTWLFNDNGRTYAPAFMLDRDAALGKEPFTPVFENLPVATFAAKVTGEQNRPALYQIALAGTHNVNDRKVEVNVTGETVLPFFTDPRVTVYIVEDNVLASREGMGQSGSGGMKFYHNHLLRAYNSVWGDEARWDGDGFSYTCTLEYPKECKVDDMQVIAFISNYDSSDPTACEIGNVALLGMGNLTTVGVDGVDVDPVISDAVVYDIQGRRLGTDTTQLAPGFYIISKTEGQKVAVEKIYVK